MRNQLTQQQREAERENSSQLSRIKEEAQSVLAPMLQQDPRLQELARVVPSHFFF